jgi:carbon-monoxide dehydrogenase medium subunit
VTIDEAGQNIVAARIALGAVGPTPIFAQAAGDLLVGKAATDENFAAAAEAAQAVATPIDDMRGTKEFRLHLVGVLTQRVLRLAVARARNEG